MDFADDTGLKKRRRRRLVQKREQPRHGIDQPLACLPRCNCRDGSLIQRSGLHLAGELPDQRHVQTESQSEVRRIRRSLSHLCKCREIHADDNGTARGKCHFLVVQPGLLGALQYQAEQRLVDDRKRIRGSELARYAEGCDRRSIRCPLDGVFFCEG